MVFDDALAAFRLENLALVRSIENSLGSGAGGQFLAFAAQSSSEFCRGKSGSLLATNQRPSLGLHESKGWI
jgi:hypothetical protein